MRIIIADDHPLIRFGVAGAVRETHEVVAEAPDSATALELVVRHRPDLLILDLDMPGPPPDETIRRAAELHPSMKVLILSGSNDPRHLRALAGVKIAGFVMKDEAPENLLQAVRVVGQGSTWFSHSISRKFLAISQENEGELALCLTKREREILGLILQGKDNAGIAAALKLAEQTIRRHASVIYQKLGVSNRLEAVVWAQRVGLTSETQEGTAAPVSSLGA
jgi:DNA-binding NarL/FixJ family response regulator